MCGLVGIAGKLELKDEHLMRRLLWFDFWRGPDSTGLAVVNNNGEADIVKLPTGPAELFDLNKFKRLLNGSGSCVFLGHNRAATKGKVSTANAHPFQFEHIVGAHNGTLDGWSQRQLEKRIDQENEVDSQSLLQAISILGPKQAIALAGGAWALSYVNLKEGTLNFIRNDERPLWYAFIKQKDGTVDKMVWASETWILEAAFHGYCGDWWTNAEGNCFFQFKDDHHYSFDISKLRKGSKDRAKPKVQEMKGDPFVPTTGGQNSFGWSPPGGNSSYSPWHDDPNNDDNILPFLPRTSAGKSRGSTTNSRQNSNRGTTTPPVVEHLDGTKDEPFAGRISRERFNELLSVSRGCCWCGDDIDWETAEGITIYDRDDKILCPKCCTSGYAKTNRIYVSARA